MMMRTVTVTSKPPQLSVNGSENTGLKVNEIVNGGLTTVDS
jgi:hypothetical protein